MSLDPALAEKWWNERYEGELERVARKNAYLHEFKDPEDLFQDMVIGVWMKAVDLFDADRVTYVNLDPNQPDYEAKLKRAFNAVLTTTMQGFLANLATHNQTGKSKWEQKVKSLETPLDGEDDGDEGGTLLDTLEDASKDPDMMSDITRMMQNVSRDLRPPLGYIMKNQPNLGWSGL